jgi:hypothetical protein
MKKYPGRRFCLGQPARGRFRHPAAGEALNRDAGKRLLRVGGPVEHGNGHSLENLGPARPTRQLHQIVAAHQPDKP